MADGFVYAVTFKGLACGHGCEGLLLFYKTVPALSDGLLRLLPFSNIQQGQNKTHYLIFFVPDRPETPVPVADPLFRMPGILEGLFMEEGRLACFNYASEQLFVFLIGIKIKMVLSGKELWGLPFRVGIGP